jgi:hypothetical protein
VIGIDDIIGRFTNVMEDEIKVFCDRVLNYHLLEGSKAAASGDPLVYHPLWPMTRDSRDKAFQSSIPEDIVSSVRLFIESIMRDYGSVDEGFHGPQRGGAQIKLDFRPKRRGKRNVATADGSQHSKFRVLQFQGQVLGAIASTLVWLRDAISSILTSSMRRQMDGGLRERESRADNADLVRAQFHCSLMNDCIRFLTVHLPAMEADFDSVLSEAVSSGVSLNSAYVAFFELLQQSAQRIASSIFEDVLRIFDISHATTDRPSKLTHLWLSHHGTEENPFRVICGVASTALNCLRDWLHPYAFTILVSEVVSCLCTVLLFIGKEIAMSQPGDLLTRQDDDSSDCGSAPEILASLLRDIALVREFFSRYSDRASERELLTKLDAVTGVSMPPRLS